MTTVAYDGKTLASDSQTTHGTMRLSNSAVKIFGRGVQDDWSIEGKKVMAFGIAGNLHAADELRREMSTFVGLKGCSRFTKGVTLSYIAITEDRTVYVGGQYEDEEQGWLCEVSAPIAVGSGGDFAMGAMAAGLSAEEAVRIAARFDVNTNESVSSILC